jgi:filamentous hemagglutinin
MPMTQATSILLSELLQSANETYDNYLSKAGHALQKHGERQGSVFPKVFGNPNAINMQAHDIANNILTHPSKTHTQRHHARFGEILDIYAPNGQGIRYNAMGKFIGFLER